jgi:Fe-S oxidoreductase
LAEILFSCATCGNCGEHCALPGIKDQLLLAFTAGKDAFLDAGQAPPPVRDYLTKVQLHGNPFGKASPKRGHWADGLDVEPFSGQEYLFWVDDVGTHDPRGQEIARSVTGVLQQAGISFGILADGLASDGNDVKAMGETALFEDLAEKNIGILSQHNVAKIITLSPHSLNVLKNDYPDLGGQYQVFHYTQVLAFATGGLDLAAAGSEVNIVFHDPCYLGRHNADYESARMILRAVPGARLVEMDRHRKNALCCGGGGGNFFTDLLSGGDDTPARVRVREAAAADAQIIAVACPLCAVMLEDAVKVENLDNAIEVREVSEIVGERIRREGERSEVGARRSEVGRRKA